jgi:diguanylate cyclase (GGDEF)-like protein
MTLKRRLTDISNRIYNYNLNNHKTSISYYLHADGKVHPFLDTLKIALFYALFGVIWISIPEGFLNMIFHRTGDFFLIGIYKDWFYVGISTLLIFGLIFRRLILFKCALKNIENNLAKQQAIEQKLNQLAYYDSLTGLPNRTLFENKLCSLISESDSNHKNFALVYIDVDNFKHINDTMGHMAGDSFLKHIAKTLVENIGVYDFVARLGGDEFGIVLSNIQTKEEAAQKVQNLQWFLRRPWSINSQEFFVSVSAGIVIYPDQADDITLLLRNADIAMYNVKRHMKDNFCFYSENLKDQNLRYIALVNELHKAIENREFYLVYQPIINLVSGKIIGVEALIRWRHPEKGVISPLDFIPIAEETGLIHSIGTWVLKTALLQKRDWEDKGLSNIKMSVNVSGKSLIQEGFVNEVRNIISDLRLNSSEVQIEITESVLIEKMKQSQKVLEDLSEMGIQIALDDFGTGYSSLTYLKNLPIDVVKLDGNFVKGIITQEEDSVIVESVIKLTHDLNLTLVAEGIETEEQLKLLKNNCCDYGQGYYFSKPLEKDMVEIMMKTDFPNSNYLLPVLMS